MTDNQPTQSSYAEREHRRENIRLRMCMENLLRMMEHDAVFNKEVAIKYLKRNLDQL